ncbi:MAG: anaerobic sulfatase maturase [Victivallaceae bacterium]
MRPFSLLIKPASFDCNLRCRYCFYLEKEKLFGAARHRMPDAVLEQMISSFMRLDMPCHSFGWQGGEPTLMGLDFFRQAVKLMKQYGRIGKRVSNGLQTNGTMLDDEWCKFLQQYNFLVGISIDGPPEIHDFNRFTIGGSGSHEQVMRGVAALNRNHVEYNVLTLVNSHSVSKPLEIYRYFRDDLKIMFHQYIECVEFDENGSLMPFAVTPEAWGEFLCTIFDEWYAHDTRQVSIRLFDSILAKMVDGVANVCSLGDNCCQYFVVEYDGSVYPCDFFVQPEWKLGNVGEDNWAFLQNLPLYLEFGKRKRQVAGQCSLCRFFPLCAGCCQKNRPGRGNVPGEVSALCRGWKMFYEHTLDRFKELARAIIRERNPHQHILPSFNFDHPGSAGKNAPCPCGSGVKYKKCCGKN